MLQRMSTETVRLHRWDEIALEKVTEMLSRKIVTGEREMIAQIYLKRGCLVPMHSHESEQMTCILQGALRFLIAGEEITVADRIRSRRNQAYVTKLAVQAVEALNASTGGYGLHLDNPVQRAWRDANAVARHVSLNWDAVGTMYGQHVFGLEPKGQY